MMWALIVDGTVAEITDLDPAGRYHPDMQWVPCGTDVQPGWLYDGQGFAEPAAPEPQPPIVFSTREYLRRFTRDEYAAARTSANVDVQWMLDNLIAAQFVDLADPDVTAGLDLLVAEGIITEARRDELLAPLAQG